MTVKLFVQTGDARPKCVGRAWRSQLRHDGVGRAPLATITPDTTEWLYGSSRMSRAKLDADCWWLVECANAEAGRAIITHDFLRRTSIGCAFDDVPPVVKSRDPNKVGEPAAGRVLASGGRRV